MLFEFPSPEGRAPFLKGEHLSLKGEHLPLKGEHTGMEPLIMMTDFPVKFKGGNAGQVDTGRLRTSNLEVAGSIPDSSIFRFRF